MESACADPWGKALATGEPILSSACYAERRYSEVLDDELFIALTPDDLIKVLECLEKLHQNG